jgi:hypothetical protein
MPPVESMKVLAAYGIFAGCLMFVIPAILFRCAIVIEEMVLRRKRSNLRPEKENK